MARPVNTRFSKTVDRFFSRFEQEVTIPQHVVHDNSPEFVSLAYLKVLIKHCVEAAYKVPATEKDADAP